MINRIFYKLFLVVLIVFISGYGLFLHVEYFHAEGEIKANEKAVIEAVKNSVLKNFEDIIPDLFILGKNSQLQKYRESISQEDLLKTQEEFITFALHKRTYSQIRFLDTSGKEVVRVDFDGNKVIPIHQALLQNKNNRYYFKQAMSLNPGQVYVSPIDLNIEHGKIERPFKPMIRFCTLVVGDNGEVAGVLILNYLAKKLLEHFDTVIAGSKGNTNLYNKDGYWIRSHDKEREWAFMFNKEINMESIYPKLWQQVQSNGEGQFISGRDLFTYAPLHPIRKLFLHARGFDGASTVKLINTQNEYTWYAVSHVEEDQFNSIIVKHVTGIASAVWLLGLFFSAVICLFATKHLTDRAELQNLLELHAKVYESTTEGITITNPDGEIIAVNDGFSKITGYSCDEVIGENPRILASGKHDKEYYKDMWTSITQQGYWEGEIINRRKNGSLIDEWLRISSVTNKKGDITHFVALSSDITQKKLTEEELHWRAHHDVLTGLKNRLALNDRMNQELNRSKRNNSKFSVLYIDLDRFKEINDNYGHHAGDTVLCDVASRLRSCIRMIDTLARIGGDEFVALLPEVNTLEEIKRFTNRILNELRKPLHFEDKEMMVDASIGVAVYPVDGKTEEELIINADKAMYSAKRDSDINISFWSTDSLDQV